MMGTILFSGNKGSSSHDSIFGLVVIGVGFLFLTSQPLIFAIDTDTLRVIFLPDRIRLKSLFVLARELPYSQIEWIGVTTRNVPKHGRLTLLEISATRVAGHPENIRLNVKTFRATDLGTIIAVIIEHNPSVRLDEAARGLCPVSTSP